MRDEDRETFGDRWKGPNSEIRPVAYEIDFNAARNIVDGEMALGGCSKA